MSGYLFIESPTLAAAGHKQDVWVHQSDFPPDVRRGLAVNQNRKLRGREIETLQDEAAAPATGHGEPPSEGDFIGVVRSFHTDSGYGFIASPEVNQKQGRRKDVYSHPCQMNGFFTGSAVRFTVYFGRKGDPRARALRGSSWYGRNETSSAERSRWLLNSRRR